MSLWRGFDFRYGSNLLIVGVTLLAFLVGLGLEVADNDIADAMSSAINLAATVLLAWAVARELEPDRPQAATGAILLAAALWFALGPVHLAAVVLALFAARILVRSTGRPVTNVDIVVILALALYASRTITGWTAGLGVAYALARDVRLPGPAPRHQRWVAFLTAIVATVGVFVRSPDLSTSWSFLAILVVVVGVLAGMTAPVLALTSFDDIGREPLLPERVLSARRTLLVIAIFSAITGTSAVAGMGPLWSAMAVLPVVALRTRPDAAHRASSSPQTPPDGDPYGA
jgi:hypothetical protein